MKLAFVVPLCPSVAVTSEIDTDGCMSSSVMSTVPLVPRVAFTAFDRLMSNHSENS